MVNSTFAFIGAGNMGGAIIKAVCKKCGPSGVFVFDSDSEKVRALSVQTGCVVCESAGEAIDGARYIVLCVKPKVIAPVLKALVPQLQAAQRKGEKQVIVSIAAGVTTEAIKEVLSEGSLSLPVIRLLPNTPVAVGKGLILVAPAENTAKEDTRELTEALSEAGAIELFPEGLIDAATPVFSSSPAFVYMFIDALSDGGVMSGLPRDKARSLAAQAVLGAAAMVLETGEHPGALKDAVCSPGGSTIVGVEQLEKGAFRFDVASAVYEAYKKTTELSK